MSSELAAGYAGDVLATEAFHRLASESSSVLIDVRTQAEWGYVGVPDLSELGKTPLFLEWQSYPAMQVELDLRRAPDERLGSSPGQAGRVPPVPVPVRRPFTPGRDRHDHGRLASMLQHLRWIRRAAGSLAPPERRRRLEGRQSALDPDLAVRCRFHRSAPPVHPFPALEFSPWAFVTKPSPFRPIPALSAPPCSRSPGAVAASGCGRNSATTSSTAGLDGSSSNRSRADRRACPCRRASSRAGSTPTTSVRLRRRSPPNSARSRASWS